MTAHSDNCHDSCPSQRPGLSPEAASTSYLDATSTEVDAAVERAQQRQEAAGQGRDASVPDYWERLRRAVEETELAADIRHIVHDLHAHPETAFEEYRSQQVLCDLLEKHGHSVVRGAYGVKTAFYSQITSPGYEPGRHPRVVIMAEYDALPGIGHACGHNVIAAAGVGAYLAAARAIDAAAPVCIELQGTPAEEGHTGKEYMIRGGSLDGVDAALMIHGFGYDIAEHVWVGRRSATVTFHGTAAHASSQPFMGKNALDAASLMYQGLGLHRQQMPPSDRLHAVIAEGGTRPSVVPDRAVVEVYARSLRTETLLELSRRVDDIARGAALMAGVGVEIAWDPHPMSLPVRNNSALAARWSATQRRRGRAPLPAGIIPDSLAASTDFGNVSQLVPGIHPMVQVSPREVALHTEAFAHWSATESAERAALDSAVGLAQVAFDYAADPQLQADAYAEFAALGTVSVESLLRWENS